MSVAVSIDAPTELDIALAEANKRNGGLMGGPWRVRERNDAWELYHVVRAAYAKVRLELEIGRLWLDTAATCSPDSKEHGDCLGAFITSMKLAAFAREHARTLRIVYVDSRYES